MLYRGYLDLAYAFGVPGPQPPTFDIDLGGPPPELPFAVPYWNGHVWVTQDIDDGVNGRMGWNPDHLAQSINVRPPVFAVGNLQYQVCAYEVHTIGVDPLLINADSINVPAGTTQSWVHGLRDPHDLSQPGLPIFVDAYIVSPVVLGADWAVTEITDTQISVKNWSGDDLAIFLLANTGHTFGRGEFGGPYDVGIVNSAEGSVPHGLGEMPRILSSFPWAPDGLVQPQGMELMSRWADETNVYMAGTGATSNLTSRMYGWIPHSIQA